MHWATRHKPHQLGAYWLGGLGQSLTPEPPHLLNGARLALLPSGSRDPGIPSKMALAQLPGA